jgi:hypothetical protein
LVRRRNWEGDLKEFEAAGTKDIFLCYATLAAACTAFSNALRHPRRSKKLLASGGTIFNGVGPACLPRTARRRRRPPSTCTI